MGGALAIFQRIENVGGFDDKDLEFKDDRRRNSLAFYIAQFVPYEEEDYEKLVDAVKFDKNAKTGGKPHVPRPSKFGKIALAILHGNMKELRNQTIVFFKSINRNYKDFGGNTILHMACQEGYYVMLPYMANPSNHSTLDTNELDINVRNDKERTPLMLCFTPPTATYTGMTFGVGADGNPLSEKPEDLEQLSDWIRPGGPKARENCIRFLVENGANVNDKDFHDFTALHMAAMWGWTTTVRFLLDSGADINAMTIAGKTALMYAVEFDHEALVIILSNHSKVNLDVVDSEGASALIYAIDLKSESSYVLSKILLQAGADPNILTNRRKTALKIACASQNMQKVDLLMDFKVQRRTSAFNLLEAELLNKVTLRLAEDEKKMALEAERAEKERDARAKAGFLDNARNGGTQKSPWGAWVEYIDKQNKQVFYYNTVTRNSVREKPKDFKPDKNRVVKEAMWGLSFYH